MQVSLGTLVCVGGLPTSTASNYKRRSPLSAANIGEFQRKCLAEPVVPVTAHIFTNSPPDPLIPRHPIKMPIAAQQRKRMLPAEGRDPDVVGWNRLAFAL